MKPGDYMTARAFTRMEGFIWRMGMFGFSVEDGCKFMVVGDDVVLNFKHGAIMPVTDINEPTLDVFHASTLGHILRMTNRFIDKMDLYVWQLKEVPLPNGETSWRFDCGGLYASGHGTSDCVALANLYLDLVDVWEASQ